MKIVFAGTPDFAVEPLRKLKENGYEIVCVVTGADKPQGRKGVLTPSPVKTLALEYGLPVFQPQKIREETERLKSLGGDLMVTCAYGQILSQEVLDVFPLGVWNVHAGLLPKYRGASPIQSCLLAGEKETGVCIMKTESGLDTGAVLVCQKTEIGEAETYGELSKRLSSIGANALLTALEQIESGNVTLTPQGEEGARVCRKITSEAGKIDFSKSCEEVVNLVRAFNPEPAAFAYLNGARVNVWKAERAAFDGDLEAACVGEILTEKPKQGLIVKCGDGALKILELQPSGSKKMSGGDFLNGRKGEKGQVFSC